MKTILLGLAFFSLSSYAFAQETGIKFENNLTWSEIKAKASAENKNIFIDVFATWCGPCKWMDANVYNVDRVAKFINKNFISVKMQMDSTTNDGNNIKVWRNNAKQMQAEYLITAYPSYLFFDSQGNIVHKFNGAIDDAAFIELASNALDPKKQYYTNLCVYKRHKLSYEQMPDLVRISTSLNEKTYAKIIAEDYINNYLYKKNENELFSKRYLLFLTNEGSDFLTSESKIFQLIYNHKNKVDSLVGSPGYSESVIGWIITKEEIYNKLWKEDKQPYVKVPKWSKIWTSIKQKYNSSYADSLLSPAKFLFYQSVRNWPEYVRCAEEVRKTHEPKTNGRKFSTAVGGSALNPLTSCTDTWGLNALAWTVFQNCIEKQLLGKALMWSELSISLEPKESKDLHQYLDTKANILYKLGDVKGAIECEYTAMHNSFAFVNEYRLTIEKMKSGIPTWKQ